MPRDLCRGLACLSRLQRGEIEHAPEIEDDHQAIAQAMDPQC